MRVSPLNHRLLGLATLALLAACGEAPSQLQKAAPAQPEVAAVAAGHVAALTQTYVSGVTPVTAYDPIYPVHSDPTWTTTSCTTIPAVGPNDGWQNPHPAFTGFNHDWLNYYFTAGWINAWPETVWPNKPVSKGPDGQSWTKYTTQVEGNGTFVIRLLADNCSWIYLDNTLVGVQPAAHNAQNTSYGVTLNGTHELSFIIFDGGGLAGGKFILETTTTPPPALNPDLDGDGHLNDADAFPLDPTRWQIATATSVTFGPGPFVFTGSVFAATATVSTGATATIAYSGDCTNAGNTCTATATYAGDATHASSTATASITIAPVPSTTTVSFGAGPFVFTGSPFTATASVSPAGSASIAYAGDCTNAGNTCTATATYVGDVNHAGSVSAPAVITIAKAPTTTTVSFGAGPFVFTGAPFTATASVSPAGSASIAYAGDCTNGGTSCAATATYAGDPNHTGSSAAAQIVITYAICAATGHDDEDDDHGDSRGHESGSTLPVTLRVCDAGGRNISSRSLAVRAVSVSPTGSLNDSGRSNPGNLFRLDDHKYQYNLSTKGFVAGNYTLDYTIGNDPTIYHYAFSIRAEKDKGKDDKGKDDKGKNDKGKNDKGKDDKGKHGD